MRVVTTEVENEGFMSLLGKNVQVWGGVYIYTGKLVGVNDTCIKLTDAAVVYETGDFSSKTWKDAQKVGTDIYIQLSAIEMFALSTKN